MKKVVLSQLEDLKDKGLDISIDARKEQYIVYVANDDHIPVSGRSTTWEYSCDQCIIPSIYVSTSPGIGSWRTVFGFGRIGRFVNLESDLSISSVLMMRGIFYHITPKNNLVVFWQQVEYEPCWWNNGALKPYAGYLNRDRPKFSKYFDTISFIATTYLGDAVERADVFINYAHGGGVVKPISHRSNPSRFHSMIIVNNGCSSEWQYHMFMDGSAAYVGTSKPISLLNFVDYNELVNGQSIGQCTSGAYVLVYGDPTIRIKKGSGEESVIYGIDMDPSSHDKTPTESVKYKPFVDTERIRVDNCAGTSIEGCPAAEAGEEKECVFGDVSEYDELCCLKLTAYADYNGYEIPIVRSTNICVSRDHCSEGCH